MPVLSRRRWLEGSFATGIALAVDGCGLHGARAIPGQLLNASSLGHRLRSGDYPAPSETRTARVVIAGGGIAGLAAAYALREAGVGEVLVIEALDEVGGNSSFGRNAVSAYPWGAHYVPLVRHDCQPVLDLFGALKIILDMDDRGRPVYDEYCLSCDPQERLWMYGRWQEGLVPQLGATGADRAQFAAFFAEMEYLKGQVGADGRPLFSIPIDQSSSDPAWRALNALTFPAYLRRRGYDSALLHWYINYCCRDDYGCNAQLVSAWAGLHYFAARNGLAANADSGTVITWPNGNGHLASELARIAQAQVQSGALVTRVARHGSGVTVDYYDAARARSVRVEAATAIVCLPRFIATRVVEGLSSEGIDAFTYAPWMVANLTLSRLPGGRGEALAYDNVIFDSALLGYVVATHQDLEQTRSDTVITYYWPLSEQDPAQARQAAIGRTLEEWQRPVVRDLLRVHPELDGHIENIDVRVWGHGMIRPTPGFLWGEARRRACAQDPPIFYAHSDQSGISIFEEAYCRGFEAGGLAARRLRTSVETIA